MRRSEIGLRLLALAMAIALLAVVHGERHVTHALTVPLEARLPSGLEPAAPLPTELRVSVAGPWSRLRSLDPSDVGPVILDLSRTGPGVAAWSVRPESLRLPPGVHVESLYPAQGTVQLRPDKS